MKPIDYRKYLNIILASAPRLPRLPRQPELSRRELREEVLRMVG